MHETRCLWCETVTKTETEFYALSLAITQNSSLTNALRSFRRGRYPAACEHDLVLYRWWPLNMQTHVLKHSAACSK